MKNISILLKEHLDKQVKKEKSFQEMKDKAKSNFKQRVTRNILESFHSLSVTLIINLLKKEKQKDEMQKRILLAKQIESNNVDEPKPIVDEEFKDDLDILLDDYKR